MRILALPSVIVTMYSWRADTLAHNYTTLRNRASACRFFQSISVARSSHIWSTVEFAPPPGYRTHKALSLKTEDRACAGAGARVLACLRGCVRACVRACVHV